MTIPPKTLGIDFGTKRIGLAVTYASLVEPLEVISYQEIGQALNRIVEICEEHHVEQIVIGISEGEMADKTEVFIGSLREKLTLPIFTTDETLSSQEVLSKLASQGKQHSGPKSGPIDHYAAAIILDEWLSTRP